MGWIASTVVIGVLITAASLQLTTTAPLWKQWKAIRRERLTHPDPARRRAGFLVLGGMLTFYLVLGASFWVARQLWGLEGGALAAIVALIVGLVGAFTFAVVSSTRQQ
jgi:hypothetical protein